MPSVMKVLALYWAIHTNDHNPPHIEVYHGTPKNHDAWAKVRIDKVEIIESFGFDEPSLLEILKVAQARQKFLSSKWSKVHGQKAKK